MTTQDVKPGIKFELLHKGEVLTTYEVIKTTATRVIYSNGRKSARGATNRRQTSSWMTIKGFVEAVKLGTYRIS